MGSSDRSQLLQVLRNHRDAIADDWYQSIAQTSFVSHSRAEVRQRLANMIEQAIGLLVAERFERVKAEAIGGQLASLHYLQPEALGRTQEVLARSLTEGLFPDQVAALQSNVELLLTSMATGFCRQAYQSILAEQEQVRKAFVAELQSVEEALRKAHQELERRVEQRTAELARTNKELRIEIAERKRAEEALRESEEKWRSLIENAPDTVLTVDREGQILFINHPVIGPSVEAALGKNIVDFVEPEYRDRVKQSIQQIFRTGALDYYEVAARDRAGTTAWYATHLGPVRRDSQVVAVMMVTRDITGKKKIEQMKDNLIRDVSHELRTPLAKTQMSLELMVELLAKETIDRAKLTRIGQVTFGSVERLLRTVESILDLSQLDAGAARFEKEPVQLADLIEEIALDMLPIAQNKGLNLVAELPPGLPQVEGNQEKLFRVLINLVDNAIKFSDQGKIVISAGRNEREVEVAVRDSGYGVKSENLTRIFERFFQEKSRFHGIGVGLAICKTIVEAYGGKIWAESPGRGMGTTVRFTLPICRGVEGRMMPKRIMIVEDDEELQELYATMLEGVDCDIVRAYDGREALEKLKEATPDLIVLDILLDEMMGDEFFVEMKREPRFADIPVVLSTVLSAKRCQNLLDMDHRTVYLQKPFGKDQLLEVLRRHLEREA